MDVAKRKRASARAWLTKAIGRSENIDEDCDLTEIEITLTELEKRMTLVEESQLEVESYFTTDEEMEEDIAKASEYEDKFFKMKKKLVKRLQVTQTQGNGDYANVRDE